MKPDRPRRRAVGCRRWRSSPASPGHGLVASVKVAPIWLGSGTKEEVTVLKDIKDIVPEDMHLNESVIAIERFEADARPYEAQKKFAMAADCLEQAINIRRKFLGETHRDFLAGLETATCGASNASTLGNTPPH